jgi:hypothetical protein
LIGRHVTRCMHKRGLVCLRVACTYQPKQTSKLVGRCAVPDVMGIFL